MTAFVLLRKLYLNLLRKQSLTLSIEQVAGKDRNVSDIEELAYGARASKLKPIRSNAPLADL